MISIMEQKQLWLEEPQLYVSPAGRHYPIVYETTYTLKNTPNHWIPYSTSKISESILW